MKYIVQLSSCLPGYPYNFRLYTIDETMYPNIKEVFKQHPKYNPYLTYPTVTNFIFPANINLIKGKSKKGKPEGFALSA